MYSWELGNENVSVISVELSYISENASVWNSRHTEENNGNEYLVNLNKSIFTVFTLTLFTILWSHWLNVYNLTGVFKRPMIQVK